MKKFTFYIVMIFCCMVNFSMAQNIGISPNSSTPHPSAGLDIDFLDKGILIPRVSLANTTTASPVTDPATSLLVYNTATANDVTPGYYFWNGTAWTRLSASLDGSGAANYFPKWTSENTLGSSQVYDDGTNVGIGTATPGAKLEVAGTLKVTDGTQGANKILTSDADGMASWQESELAELASAPCAYVDAYLSGTVTTGSAPYSVAVSGDYAYVVNLSSNSLQIFNVSTPSSPFLVGSAVTESGPISIAVLGDYTYVVNYYSNSLQIFDVSTPSSPFLVGSAVTGSYPRSVAVSGDYAYVVNLTSNSLQLFNVSAPSSPFLAGSAGTGSHPHSVAVSGDYAYVVNESSNSLQIFNVSAPSSPYLVGSAGTGVSPWTVAVSGDYAYVVNYISESLQIFNVSAPSSPYLVGSAVTVSYPWSFAVSGDYAYVVYNNSDSLQIFNVSVPSSPFLAGSAGTGSSSLSVAVSGDYAYVVGGGNGFLQIFHIGCISVIIIDNGNLISTPMTWTDINADIFNVNPGNVGIGTTSPTAKLDVTGGNIRTNQQLVSTMATGTAPLSVTSSTLVSNLNADLIDNYHAGNSSGQIPLSNSTVNTNLNADLLDGSHASAFSAAGHSHTLTLTGDLTGSGNVTGSWSTTLANSGVSAGTFGSTGANVPNITVDAKGRITSAANRALSPANIGAWSLTGNLGTVAGTNFIGTTDNVALDFRTNNSLKTRLTVKGAIETYNTGYSVFIGEGAGASDNLTNKYNVLIGYQAGYTNISGMYNTATGANALKNNTVSSNTAFGYSALMTNSTGNFNTATGAFALQSNITGVANTAFGMRALNANGGGGSNTACGAFSMEFLTSGSWNTAVGNNSLNANITGNCNTAIGNTALMSSTGGYNTACGYSALSSNTSGTDNTAIGSSANVASGNLTNATAIGAYARVNASNTLVLGSINGVNGATATVNVGIGTNTPAERLDVSGGNIRTNQQLVSTVVTGTAPIIVSSTTSVINLNADLLDGLHAGNADGQIPISNSTVNSNLNADLLDGQHATEFAASTGSSNYIQNQTAANQAAGFRINGNGIFNGGKIGIGTASPTGDLHLESTGDVTIVLNADTDNAGGEEDNPRIEMRQDGGGVVGALGLAGSANIIHNGDLVNALYLVHEWDNALQFGTNNEIKMTILPTGNIGIGTNGPVEKLDVNGSVRAKFNFVLESNNTTPTIAGMRHDGNNLLYVYNDNACNNGVYLAEGGTSWQAFSDIRLKKDFEPVNNILDDFCKLNVTRFHMKTDPDTMAKRLGFIAQEVQPLFPYVVSSDGEYLGLSYTDFGVLSVEAIKELRAEKDAEIAALKNKNGELEKKLESLQAQIEQIQQYLEISSQK